MNVLIVEDHEFFRSGVCLMLKRMGIADTCVHQADSAARGLHLLKRQADWRLILLDINLPDMEGEIVVKTFRQACISASLILLSGIEDEALARRCVSQGAQGFIHKSTSSEEFAAALERVRLGDTVWLDGLWKSPLTVAVGNDQVKLTDRQIEVLQGVCQGLSNKEIARHLQISDNTVRIHIGAILAGLGAKTRSEAIVISQKLGILA